jgi:hypothetical protein
MCVNVFPKCKIFADNVDFITLFSLTLLYSFKLFIFIKQSIMVCAKRNGVYAFFLVLLIGTQSTALFGKGEGAKEGSTVRPAVATSAANVTEFQWKEHSRLSWDDFRGPVAVTDDEDETAAVTHCGMGFKTAPGAPGEKPQIIVFNKFYTNKSWVRGDAKLPEILEHEQGHFDLCEIYTRKLRARITGFDLDKSNARQALYDIYYSINGEYEARQQRYEDETTHGVNEREQKRWTATIERELEATNANL